MARSKSEKDYNEKSQIEIAKEMRRKAWEEKQKEEKKIEDSRDEFRKFFIKIKNKLKLDSEMENVIWTHFKASGFDKKEKFEEGIKHFGYIL